MRDNLARINEFIRGMVFNMNMEDVLQAACETARDIVNADRVAIYLQEPTVGIELYLVSSLNLPAEYQNARPIWNARPERYQNGSFVVRDVALLPKSDLASGLASLGVYQATAEIPLHSGQDLVGVLVVYHLSPYRYEKSELDFLETLAFQVMVAADNAGLLRTLETYATEQAQLVELSRISTASLELAKVIPGVSAAMSKIMHVKRVYIGLRDSHRPILRFYGFGDEVRSVSSLDEFVGLQAPTLYNAQNATPTIKELMTWCGDTAIAVAPLVANNRVLGVIVLGMPKYFGLSESRQLELAANQIATQLYNAQQFNEVENALERRLRQLVMIERVAQRISSTFDVDQMIGSVLEAAINATEADMAALALIKDGGNLEIIGQEIIDGEWRSVRVVRSQHEGIMGRVVRTGEILIVPDNSAESDYILTDAQGRYQSSLVVPLLRDNEVIGVLNVESRELNFFTEDHAEFLHSLAGHAVISIQNARLLQEQQHQNARLLESNNRISAILDSSSDGIILLDQNGLLIQFNGSAEDLLGINLDEYKGQNLATMLLERVKYEDDSPETREGLKKMARILRLEPERITRHEYELKRRGQTVYVEEVGSPVLDAQHRVVGRLLVLRDMTEQRLLASYRDEITNMAVHDLRGPLGAIISSLTLALEIIEDPMDVPLEQTLVPSLQVSLDSANNLLGLVDSLLDIAKMETRQLPLKLMPWDVEHLVSNALATLWRLFQESGITVEQRIPENLPTVNVDEDKIRRVIINLLDNALRYSPHGGKVMIEAQVVENGRRVQVRITDSGKGIPHEERERIFEKFRQIKDNAPERGRKGSGLGLTFCKLAIEAHGGQIWVEEHGPLPGASIAFTLPVAFENRNNS